LILNAKARSYERAFLHQLSMKKVALILSDLWGIQGQDWTASYISYLEGAFDTHLLDVKELAGIHPSVIDESEIHAQFVSGGIDRAVNQLITRYENVGLILGFSIGGSIGWKCALSGLNAERLVCASSTRLRHETKRPMTQVELYYGTAEEYRPSTEWETSFQLQSISVTGDHHIYRQTEVCQKICSSILRTN
jgi:hypothetical protein